MNEIIKPTTGRIATITTDLFDAWIDYLEVKDKTKETYTRNIRPFVYYLKANGINQPTRDDIKAYRDALRMTKKPNTVQAYLMALKQFFKWTESEHIYENITKDIKGAKISPDHKTGYLTSEQTKRLLSTVDRSNEAGRRDYAILLLMLTTGLRTVEVVNADVRDMRNVGNYRALFILGKGRDEKNDHVKIVPQVENAIRESLADRGRVNQDEPLFVSRSNHDRAQRLTTRSVSRIVAHYLDASGLKTEDPTLTAHSLRHTCATLNYINGGSIEQTQQLLRHNNINTTMIYVNSIKRAENNSEQRVYNAIFD